MTLLHSSMDKQHNESWRTYAKRMNYVYESEYDGREIIMSKKEIMNYEKEQTQLLEQRLSLIQNDYNKVKTHFNLLIELIQGVESEEQLKQLKQLPLLV
jgi:hypothetical protein